MDKNKDIIPDFFMNPRYRILRHLLLLTVIFFIAAGFIWYVPEENMTSLNKYIGLAYYIFIFAGGIYFNMYVLVPKLLLKNRWFLYFFSLVIIVIIVLVSVILIQEFLYESNQPIETTGYFSITINLLANLLSFVLLFAGTTTPILFRYWMSDMKRVDELESTTLESELKLLKNQINPHFLFNMLNNANVLIKKNNEEASDILFKLEDLLRYQINDSSKDKVILSSDIHFLNDFLNLEKVRRDKFEFTISKEGNINQVEIPPLLFIPFVENAVKHNNDSENASYVHLFFKVFDNKLSFKCINSKPETEMRKSDVGGIGLANIKRRLELLYPNRYSLEIKDDEMSYSVALTLSL